ncbi:hypothetical protein OX90_06080 [Pseudomonas coronafaciens pv. porri]|uniref:Uncharacterized protein n=1 Tax=Pseudomonas coronafaciens pv. porri TaxID=83964 RepID=A0ABR5JSE5_9PSED|nr:hypothetical protein [Pseudomonas coronafaciens]KOP51088.1 hypothetical protein OX88_26380 [Pseudomonas coronafaciens pv. porri]KOP60423.1 hypothetical protein OX90_06080 [Pseudomonas coronafaciens pv. porri]KPY23763.1 Unknown protein sequence [Pseudomonas coronafaciens pv. porri]RMU87574.1 hypothetical protein ALP22_04034 [Pseudomonas coronafaciens pv. porri]
MARDDLQLVALISKTYNMLCHYADLGGDAEQLLQVFDKLVALLDESDPEALLERLRTIIPDVWGKTMLIR